MSSTSGFDDITAEDLREQGSLKWTKFGGDTIGAFIAEMDFGLDPHIAKALHHAVDTVPFGYLPPGLRAELSDATAAWQRKRYGWSVDPATVHPVADVLAALELTMLHFSRPDSPIIVPTPAYMPFLTLPALHRREVIEVPMVADGGRYVMDLDGIDRAFRAGAQLLVLCNPHNPVGRVFTAEELAGVTEVVDRHGGRVFADEVHAPLTYPGHTHLPYADTSPTAAAHTITGTSASKAWNLPGLRCGQLILTLTAPDDIATWDRVGAMASFGASTLGVVANIAAYRSGRHWLDEVVGYLDRNRRGFARLLTEYLPQVGYRPPEGTYLGWLDCRKLDLGPEPATFWREQAGVAVVDGAECGESGRGHVRLTLATPGPILDRIVTRMSHAVDRR